MKAGLFLLLCAVVIVAPHLTKEAANNASWMCLLAAIWFLVSESA